MKKTIEEGEIFPAWYYGCAYRDFDTNRSVCYPMPLHIVVRWGRDLIFWLRRVGRPGYRQSVERAQWSSGYRDGCQRADGELASEYNRGYREGWKDSLKVTIEAAKTLANS